MGAQLKARFRATAGPPAISAEASHLRPAARSKVHVSSVDPSSTTTTFLDPGARADHLLAGRAFDETSVRAPRRRCVVPMVSREFLEV
jgi:hypothetical protein